MCAIQLAVVCIDVCFEGDVSAVGSRIRDIRTAMDCYLLFYTLDPLQAFCFWCDEVERERGIIGRELWKFHFRTRRDRMCLHIPVVQTSELVYIRVV